MARIDVGTRVRSKRVGNRAIFFGTVEQRNGASYHVRADDDGKLWHRGSSELALETPPQKKERKAKR